MTGMKTSLVILHLSDLHFGPHSRFADEKPQQTGERFAAAIERHREEANFAKIRSVVAVSRHRAGRAEDSQIE
jgi:hypothetical protein